MRDATNTGYVNLTRHDGNLVITTPQQVIDGLDIYGNVVIKAPFAILRRCIIRGGPPITQGQNALLSIVSAGAGGYVVEDCTLTPQYPNVRQNAIFTNQAGILQRLNISGTADGVVIYGNGVTLQDSYLHDFVSYPSDPAQGGKASHSDAIALQAGQGVTIRRNAISGGSNAAVIITQDAGVVGDLQLDDNDIDGGQVSVNVVTNGNPLSNIKMRRNHFGRAQTIAGGAIMANPKHCAPDITGSVWADTGQAITIKRGA